MADVYKLLLDDSQQASTVLLVSADEGANADQQEIEFTFRNPAFLRLQNGQDDFISAHKNQLLGHWRDSSKRSSVFRLDWHGESVTAVFDTAANIVAARKANAESDDAVKTATRPADGDVDPETSEEDEAVERGIWKHLLKQIPACAVVLSPTGQIKFASQTLSQVFQTTQDDFTSEDLISLPKGYTARHEDGSKYAPAELPLARTINRRERVKGETIFFDAPHTSGSLRYTSLPIFEPENSENCLAIIAIIEDTRESMALREELDAARAEKEAVLRSNRLKDEFVSMLSHELKTPIHGILGFLDIIKDPATSPTEREQVISDATNTCHGLAQNVEDLLMTRQLKSLQVEIARSSVETRSLIMNVVGNFDPARPSTAVATDIADNVPNTLWLDERAVSNALRQLLRNAFECTNLSKGNKSRGANFPVTVKVRWTANETGVQLLEISVTNVGSLPADVSQIFSSFTQTESVMTRSSSGLGLGLYIAHTLAELHGGDLTCDTAENVTTFILRVPASLPSRQAQHAKAILLQDEKATVEVKQDSIQQQQPEQALYPERSETSSNSKDSLHSPKSILVAEDEKVNGMIVRRALEKAGYTVELAVNGQIAVDAFAKDPSFDLVIMDLMMPIMDGLDASLRIREIEKERNKTRSVPIVAFTASSSPQTLARCIEVGMNSVLQKPLSGSKLVEAINPWISASVDG